MEDKDMLLKIARKYHKNEIVKWLITEFRKTIDDNDALLKENAELKRQSGIDKGNLSLKTMECERLKREMRDIEDKYKRLANEHKQESEKKRLKKKIQTLLNKLDSLKSLVRSRGIALSTWYDESEEKE